jgi:peptidoglycan hydrolase-like protein with peptidoglycan-binding domain
LGEAKVVSHASRNSDFNGVAYADFRDALCPLLQQLSDSDLRELSEQLQRLRYFNVVVQAHTAAVEAEKAARGWSDTDFLKKMNSNRK